MKFSLNTIQHLGHYVYALVDPRNRSIFYVGKASANNRAFSHLKSNKDETAKQRRINDIKMAGHEPVIEVLRYGLGSAKECFEIEAAIIDALGIENLTNEVRGHGVDRGRQLASEVERLHGSKAVDVDEITDSFMLFFVNRTYSPTKSEQEIYDSIRQYWHRVSANTRTPDSNGKLLYPIALGIVNSIVIRVYSIAAWFPANSTLSSRTKDDYTDRWEFVGQLLPEHPIVGRRLTKNGKDIPANQIGYAYIN